MISNLTEKNLFHCSPIKFKGRPYYFLRCLRHFDSSVKSGREIAMCVAFDQTGRYITAVRKSHPPVLYHIDRDTSLAEFCEKGYGNTVTRKSVCFAGQKDEVRQM